MKKLFNYALIGAIALTGSTMLTSCSSSDDAAAENNNPNYDPDTQTVYAQFVFNVSTGNQATTRQSSLPHRLPLRNYSVVSIMQAFLLTSLLMMVSTLLQQRLQTSSLIWALLLQVVLSMTPIPIVFWR